MMMVELTEIPPTILCPACHAEGRIAGIGCPGMRLVIMTCEYCQGTGRMESMKEIWMQQGRALKARRMNPYRSTRQACHRYGIHASELARAEAGLIDPMPFISQVES